MKKWFKPILIFLIVMGFLGTTVMLSGIMPISASSGHWPITEWILSFSMKRSISTYTMMMEPPHLDDPDMIQRGAGHYEIGCRHCHGGAEKEHFLGQKSTPVAPHLSSKVSDWKPEELFRIIKHGVKFTGMPAWPSMQRDDEVWSMVAFLLKFPKLNEESYQALIHAKDADKISNPILKSCSNCHGVDGNGRETGDFPILAGQNESYLEHSLKAYVNGERHSGTMQLVSSHLGEEMIKELSHFYSKQKRIKRMRLRTPEVEKAIKRGEIIAQKGILEQRVAACIGCHGPFEGGQKAKSYFPDLRGQPASYLMNQLELFLSHKRGGSEHVTLMEKAVTELTSDQIKDVSLYYESLTIDSKEPLYQYNGN